MTNRELIAHLQTFDLDLEVICTRCSDYQFFDEDDVTTVLAVDKGPGSGYLMAVREPHAVPGSYDWRIGSTMAPEDVARAKTYLHFEGN